MGRIDRTWTGPGVKTGPTREKEPVGQGKGNLSVQVERSEVSLRERTDSERNSERNSERSVQVAGPRHKWTCRWEQTI